MKKGCTHNKAVLKKYFPVYLMAFPGLLYLFINKMCIRDRSQPQLARITVLDLHALRPGVHIKVVVRKDEIFILIQNLHTLRTVSYTHL